MPYPTAILPSDTHARLCRMALHQGWYATRQHMIKQGYSLNAVATILTAVLWHNAGDCSLDSFML